MTPFPEGLSFALYRSGLSADRKIPIQHTDRDTAEYRIYQHIAGNRHKQSIERNQHYENESLAPDAFVPKLKSRSKQKGHDQHKTDESFAHAMIEIKGFRHRAPKEANEFFIAV